MLRDNQDYGEWDEDALAELLTELARAGADLDLTGFGEDELTRILDGIDSETPADPDAVLALPDSAESELGEIYELGPHRLPPERRRRPPASSSSRADPARNPRV
jgi:hypothetical protein